MNSEEEELKQQWKLGLPFNGKLNDKNQFVTNRRIPSLRRLPALTLLARPTCWGKDLR
jgi:hypothetical protein